MALLSDKKDNKIAEKNTGSDCIDVVFENLECCDDSIHKLNKSLNGYLVHQVRNISSESKEKKRESIHVARLLIQSLSIKIQHIESLLEPNIIDKVGSDSKKQEKDTLEEKQCKEKIKEIDERNKKLEEEVVQLNSIIQETTVAYFLQEKDILETKTSMEELIKVHSKKNQKLEEEAERQRIAHKEKVKELEEENKKLIDKLNENKELINLPSTCVPLVSPMNFIGLKNDNLVHNGYFGFNYENLRIIDVKNNGLWVTNTKKYPKSRYAKGCTSPPNVVFNNGGKPASILSIGSSTFTVYSLWVTPARNNNLKVTFEGFTSDSRFVISQTIILASPDDTRKVVLEGFSKLSKFKISTSQITTSTGNNVVIDDIMIAYES